MSVLIETSLGDIIVDLELDACPKTSLNFLKLCKSYYYNFTSFHNVVKDFIAQTGDPTDTGNGGSSVFSLLPPSSPSHSSHKYFVPETSNKLKHAQTGTVSMAIAGTGDGRGCGSQFFFTLAENLDYLDGKHAPFGQVIEGIDTLIKINEAFTDGEGKPLRDIRIRHVVVLDDPFPDPEGLVIPPASPVPTAAQLASLRVGDEEEVEEVGDEAAKDEARRAKDARAQALTLEMVGDLPFADVAPPENVLFVCKLNQVTKSEDLELIFSRFGTILSCEIICDAKTGDSLQYAFIEFKEREEAERAYIKMDNVLVDDRRIHVDFSQSVSKLHDNWVFKKTGGRAPPNKGARNRPEGMRREFSPDNSTNYSSRSPRRSSNNDLVFDIEDIDDRERKRHRDHQDGRSRYQNEYQRPFSNDRNGSAGRSRNFADRQESERHDRKYEHRAKDGGGGHPRDKRDSDEARRSKYPYQSSGRRRSRSPADPVHSDRNRKYTR